MGRVREWIHSLGQRKRGRAPATAGEAKNLEYDRQTVAVMQRCMRPDSLGVDGGAHRGAILREMFRIAPQGRHYAFEPLPRLARDLSRKFPRARVRELALGNRPGTAEFHHVTNDPGYSGLRRRAYDRPDPVIETLQVQVARLDDVLGEDELPAFIKLDLEGGEYHALQGATGTIARARPVIVFEAGERSSGRYGVSPEMIFQFFDERMNYALTTMRDWLDGGPGLRLDEFLEVYRTEFFFVAFPVSSTTGTVSAASR